MAFRVLSNFLAIFFKFFFSISRNFTKFYLHAKFQINWTIQTEITEGVAEYASPVIPICKKPSLFRCMIKIFRGAGVVTPSKPLPPTNNFCLYPPPVLRCFWKDPLIHPTPTTPLQASFTATPTPSTTPSPSPLKILIIHSG